MKEKKNKKLVIGSGLFILLISAAGGGVYFAEQNQPIAAQEVKKDIEQEHPAESYIQSVYTTYSDEIVSTWNDLSNGNLIDLQEAQKHVQEWYLMLDKQGHEYDSLNLPIEKQISIIDEYITVSQEDVSAEQRKRLRILSSQFVEGHESVSEELLKFLKENKANYSIEEDGTINYQFL
ncbi:hypothetical protein [Lysinibacillus xylanilyticus]|uniref:Uncharacterized protein n=1 Tax=Lysinibacillus xylanilyticus TaxID=582475 RepID=A0A2M9QA26_9BACI|nr:hypothetical protein [Lysinibacillus xylanilyticus]PJO44924.1 hypothetical protein CWD94_04360 [Lysinibacillus xylanilyticus]